MTRRSGISVPIEEIQKQKGYIEKIKKINEEHYIYSGHQKTYLARTFGCQMNENDSEKLEGMLCEMGYVPTLDDANADFVIFNTCCVRQNAEEKVYGHLGALKSLKQQKEDMIIAVCGCMPQQQETADIIRTKYRHVDLVFGTHNLYKFPQLLYEVITTRKNIIEVEDIAGNVAEGIPILRKEGIKAWVTVMYGCNNFCSYCIVPYVRGRERSRKPEDILNEIKELAEKGFKEITLLGQNVNSYGKDLNPCVGFADLIRMVNAVQGIERIRFATSHPKDISDELIKTMAECDKVCEHLHLPIQAGSTKILKEMNRKYTKEQYLELVIKVKSKIPDIALTTDIIVGFPGETEADFEDTLDIIKKVRFDSAYTFIYSKRTGTPAANMQEQIEDEIKKRRFDRLLELQNQISKEINDSYAGRTVEVVVEGSSKNNPERLTGRTRTNKVVNFEGTPDLIGKLANVRVTKAMTWHLEGEIVK